MSALTKMPVAQTAASCSPVTNTIVEATVQACRRAYGNSLSHIILTGSLARNEATLLPISGGCAILGDAEFVLVFDRGFSLPTQVAVDALTKTISRQLERQAITCQVHLAAVHPAYLCHLPRHIFSYELRVNGRVVHGNPEILRLIPPFSREMVEREDAWRMLSNRMIEWLENLAEVPDGQAEPGMAFFYSSVKLYIDSATSLLVFLGGYEPTYCERAQRLAQIVGSMASCPNLPLQLTQFAADVTRATRWKISPDLAKTTQTDWSFCMAVRDYARRLWSWELGQMAGHDFTHSPLELIEELGRSLGLAHRWRGWLRAAREMGWWHSRQDWPRWRALARRGSPRHWLYAVAAECASREEIFSHNQAPVASSGLALPRLRACLPVVWPEGIRNQDGWRALVRDLGWNYHHFVECTRA